MTDSGAGVDIVVVEGGADHFLDNPYFFIGTPGRGDSADAESTMLFLNPAQAICCELDRFIPGDGLPLICDAIADHRFGDPVLVIGVTPGEASLNAGMTMICLAVFPGHHADNLLPFHFCFEGTTHSAVSACGDDTAIRHAMINHRFFHQSSCWARLYTGAAGNTFTGEKVLCAGCDPGREPTSVNGERESTLDFFAGAYAPGTNDALTGVVGKIGVRLIDWVVGMIAATRVPHVAKTNLASHVLQFAVAVSCTGQAVEWMI